MGDRHIIVLWVKEGTYSVSNERYVRNNSCLLDPDLVGLVEHADPKRKAPKEGWQVFPAKVLAISGKFMLLYCRNGIDIVELRMGNY